MDSSRADWVLGLARLISSASTMFAKSAPGLNSKSPRSQRSRCCTYGRDRRFPRPHENGGFGGTQERSPGARGARPEERSDSPPDQKKEGGRWMDPALHTSERPARPLVRSQASFIPR